MTNPIRYRSIVHGNDCFVAVAAAGEGRASHSIDGIDWTLTDAPASTWQSVTAGNGKFVAVASSGDTSVMTSKDGVIWTGVEATGSGWQSVCFGGGIFVSVGRSSQAMHSENGTEWFASTVPESNNWKSVIYAQGKFVAVSSDGANRVMYSVDGVSWNSAAAAGQHAWNALAYGDSKFVSVASDTGSKMYSLDGIDWELADSPDSDPCNAIVFANETFVAVGNHGAVMSSDDGVQWSAGTSPEANPWSSITFGAGKFVAVAPYGKKQLMYSTTGKSKVLGRYYDKNNNVGITGDELVNRFGIDPADVDLKELGIAELTVQPTNPVAGYQAIGDKFEPIEDKSAELEHANLIMTVQNKVLEANGISIEPIDAVD